jgi:hypothetical protein
MAAKVADDGAAIKIYFICDELVFSRDASPLWHPVGKHKL